MDKNLSKLNRVEIRKIFKDEARDFTPWLATEENIKLLSDEIGIEIKTIEIEAGVGKYSADILAEEEGTGRKIVIENQLDVTNHDHLGKILTYSSGRDAEIIIWITTNFREEHQKAIAWLNEHTDENIAFFAIKIELWQIDNSNPAAKFEVLEKPNEWAKIMKQSYTNELTDTRLLQLDFWSKLKLHIKEKDKNMRLQTPRPQHWYDISMGSSDAHIGLTVNTRENSMGCEIYISRNKELFNYLKDRKNKIEKILGDLEWVDAPVASRIKIINEKFNLENKDNWDNYFAWLHEQVVQFKKVFGKNITEFKNK